MQHVRRWLPAVLLASAACGDTPACYVVLANDYPPSSGLVVYRAFWQNIAFNPQNTALDTPFAPLAPGAVTTRQPALAASANTAYVLIAPGWDPAGTAPPSSFIVLQSREGFPLSYGETLTISVDDTSFAGNCASGSILTQQQADFLTQRVFTSEFTGLQYDAATCTTTPVGDAGP